MLHIPLFNSGQPVRTTSNRVVSKFLGRLVAIWIAALLLIVPLSLNPRDFTASAEQISGSKASGLNHFVLYQSASGEVVCRAATLDEGSQLDSINPSNQGLQQINHLQSDRYAHKTSNARTSAVSGTNLTIILRATTQLQNNPAAQNAFIRAAQNWETLILSPITIYIDVDFGTTNFGQPWGANVLGSTSTPGTTFPYQSVRTNLIAEANGEGNATKQGIFNALPSTTVPTDLGNASTTDVPDANARAIGLLPTTAQSGDSAARIAFNSNHAYDFDPSDGITSGQTDFDAVATHEIGHALGFVSDAGEGLSKPAIWDLYRFRTGTTSGAFPTALRIVTVGGSPDPLQFDFVPGNLELGLSTGGPSGVSTNGGDGWQSSHWKHVSSCSGYIGVMDPSIPSSCRRTITLSDQLALTSFGYNLTNSNPPPPPPPPPPAPANDNFANAQVISGCSGSVAGVNISATKEPGEPSHSPDNNQGGASVWYQWQAPVTSTVTITTAGSNFDTVLAVYTGPSVSSLTVALQPDGSIAKNDDIPDVAGQPHNVTSSVTVNVTAGTIYKIAVDGYDNVGAGLGVGDINLNWTEANCTQTPTIQFSATNYTVGEGDGHATITVNRTGDTSGAATVDYRTTDTDTFTVGCAAKNGTAFGRCDYATVVGTLSFAGGEAAKTFVIPIIDDSYAEGTETFGVALSNPTGATLGAQTTATVTINDNETVDGPNPILLTNDAGIAFFVRQHYLDFLGREPEVGEPWSPILRNCSNQFNTDPANSAAGCDRITVSGAFFGSPEFKDKGIYVIDFYRVAFNRLPQYSEFSVDLASITGATAAETNAKRAAFANNFVLRAEFATLAGMSNSTYVTTLMSHMGQYNLTSITTPDPANPDGTVKVTLTTNDLINRLNGVGGTLTRAQVLRAIVQSDEVTLNLEAVNAFVASQYYGYLRRTPDTGGFNSWVNYLGAHPSDFRTMVNGFVNSTEYRLRFGPQ